MLSQNDYELYASLCTNVSASLAPTHLLVALLTEYRTVAQQWITVPTGLCKFLTTNKTVTDECVLEYSLLSLVTTD